MAANVEVYQGNQIGGCITVISTDKTKIVIDYGENLPGAEKESPIEFDWENEKVDAVFFTHYHGDHIGRFMEIPDEVPLYMGEVTYKVMINIRKALKDWNAVKKLQERLENGTISFVERDTPIYIGDDIVVTGYSVDHSAYDAYMYLIEADGTNILHTGDFRDHGHRGHVIRNGEDQNVIINVIKYYIKKKVKKIDILIIEGTMMGERAKEKPFSEKDLMAWAETHFKDHRHVFLKISSTNVDSLASFYQAAKANGIKMYANYYIRNQFRVYRAAGQKYGTRMYDFDNTEQIPYISDKEGDDNAEAFRTIEKMKKKGFVAIVSEYEHYERLMDEFSDVNPELIYSMWDGYLNPKRNQYNKKLDEFCKKYNAIQKHTSGHAYPQLIEQVITEVNPTQAIWPIHTENAEEFKNLNISEDLKRKLKNMKELTLVEQEVLENMEDHRWVSETLENAFITGGLSEFGKFIMNKNKETNDKHKKLAVLLRGNDNKIIVYKDNHKIWELSARKASKNVIKCKVSFDFNHARYSENWPSKLDELLDHSDKGLGFELPKHKKNLDLVDNGRILVTRNEKGDVTGGEIGIISCTSEHFSEEFVKRSYDIISGFIKDFFKSQEIDYFREKVAEKYPEVKDVKGAGAANYVEKRWQQRLLFHFNMRNTYYAYDLEFSQKYPDADFVKRFAKKNGDEYSTVKADVIKEKLGTNEPDMLAIRYGEKQVPEALVLIEVKSTEDACKGEKSGVKKHMEGMDKYAKQEIFMKKRRRDAYESLCQFQRMGIIKEDIEIKKIPDDLPVEKVILFTNANVSEEKKDRGSLRFFGNHRSEISEWSMKYDCKVWTTESNYWDEIIKINHDPFKD